jgi:hypothetical protein
VTIKENEAQQQGVKPRGKGLDLDAGVVTLGACLFMLCHSNITTCHTLGCGAAKTTVTSNSRCVTSRPYRAVDLFSPFACRLMKKNTFRDVRPEHLRVAACTWEYEVAYVHATS